MTDKEMNDELHCWRVSGPIGGITGHYPVEQEYDPNTDVTIIYW